MEDDFEYSDLDVGEPEDREAWLTRFFYEYQEELQQFESEVVFLAVSRGTWHRPNTQYLH